MGSTKSVSTHFVALFAVVLAVSFPCEPIRAAIPISLDSPTAFFTNVAARLVRSEFNLDLNHLQIYPNNQYTPAVHRLLQVTANLYDCTTNRTSGVTPEYPYFPSVFRPLFRKVVSGTNTSIVIAGFREVTDATMADRAVAPMMVDLSQDAPILDGFPTYGTPFSPFDTNEVMVSGMPLIIGARKGIPNFNEFSMQTKILVTRLLEFRRSVSNGPVTQTNQMYVAGISNIFGVEAWNSYRTNYPRGLRLDVSVTMTAVMTNETGVNNVIFSNSVVRGSSLLIPANSWAGWTSLSSGASMVLPFGTTTGFTHLTNSTYRDSPPRFEPESHVFDRSFASNNFYIPHWWLNLQTRLLFTLVDTAANRIVDYVNLNSWERTLDIDAKLLEGSATFFGNPADYKNPANQWLTNRLGDSTSLAAATYGIINQIQAGLYGTPDLAGFTQDPYSGLDAQSAVDGFRFNLVNGAPIYPKDSGKVFYKSNVFYTPFDPYRPIYIHTSWQANDPLVHFLISDLSDLTIEETNRANFASSYPPLPNLGQINKRFSSWGGNPMYLNPLTDKQAAVKDPGVMRPDDWNFPQAQTLGTGWIGGVHRGTPWQTIFLKSTNILDMPGNLSQNVVNWVIWTGNSYFTPSANGSFVLNALYTAPTNDWHLVSLLNNFFNTNDVRKLASLNQTSAQGWAGLLDGMTVLTNPAQGQLTPVVISSNSPQAAAIGDALVQIRYTEPGQFFRGVGDILATPELSLLSPFLDVGSIDSLNDEALEALPAQLLPLLRADSIATGGAGLSYPPIQFSGIDGYSYAVQVSSDLSNWTSIGTNMPENGFFYFMPGAGSPPAQFYRSLLLP